MASPQNDPSRYFIRLRGQVKGPFSIEQLSRMVGRGQFSTLHQVSTDQTKWMPAGELTNLFPKKAASATAETPETAAPAGPREWYYNTGEAKVGPVDEAFIKNLIVMGKIDGRTLLWRPGLRDWLEAKEFFPNAFRSRRGLSTTRWLAVSAATLLVLIGGATAGYYYWETPTTTVAKEEHAPAAPSRPVVASAGLINSTDVEDKAVNAALDDATGMLVTYLSIDLEQGEHHELWFSHGTCFVVTPEGYALTNKHVVDEFQKFDNATEKGRIGRLTDLLKKSIAEAVLEKGGSPDILKAISDRIELESQTVARVEPKLVAYFGTRHFPVELIYVSNRFDMAAIRIDRPSHAAHFALRADNDASKLTDVVALGFPGVSQNPVTAEEIAVLQAKQQATSIFGPESHRNSHKVSAFAMTMTRGEVNLVQQESGGIYNTHHTATIRGGNSGGPLVFRRGDLEGVVYGINTILLGGGRVGVDSPVNVAFPVAQMREELESDAKIPNLTWR